MAPLVSLLLDLVFPAKAQEGGAVCSSGGTLDQQLQCTIQDRWMQKLQGFPQGPGPMEDESYLVVS